MPTHAVTITYYEYDPTYFTEFTLSLAGTPEVNGDHVAGIPFGGVGVSWTMVNDLGVEVPVPNSFLFTSAGEEYKLRARGSLPAEVDTWTYAPIQYSVSAAYAPAWAQLKGEIIPTVTRNPEACPPTLPVTIYAPTSDTTIASFGLQVTNWPFGGINCGENANCSGGTVPQTWVQIQSPSSGVYSGTLTVSGPQADTAFLMRVFDISGSVSSVFSVQQMSPTVTTNYRIWKECNSAIINYEWNAVRNAGTGTITWGIADNVINNNTSVLADITSRVRIDLVHNIQAGIAYAGGGWYMGGSYALSLVFVAHS